VGRLSWGDTGVTSAALERRKRTGIASRWTGWCDGQQVAQRTDHAATIYRAADGRTKDFGRLSSAFSFRYPEHVRPPADTHRSRPMASNCPLPTRSLTSTQCCLPDGNNAWRGSSICRATGAGLRGCGVTTCRRQLLSARYPESLPTDGCD